LLRAFLAADRRLLQGTVCTFPFCFAKVKWKISHPQPRENNTNTVNSAFVLFFSVDFFGIKVDLDGKKKKLPGE